MDLGSTNPNFGGWEGLVDYLNCSCYLLTDNDGDIHGIILYWLSDYGNKIGEPVILGYTRSFGGIVNHERLEYVKPIMYCGGIGTMIYKIGLIKL
mgnify:CR=1 FL=1